MNTTNEATKRVPYVPAYVSTREFQKFASLGRTFKQLAAAELEAAGFTHSNSYILFSSLKALKIYDNDGNLVQREDLVDLGSRDDDIRRAAYERVVKRAYSDLLEKYSPKTVTLENAQNYFQKKEAAHSVSIKAARLFLWLLEQAGLREAEDFVKSQTARASTRRPKTTVKPPDGNKSGNTGSNDEIFTLNNKDLSRKEYVLKAVVESMKSLANSSDVVELAKIASELSKEIDAERKSEDRHTDDAP
jgi:hypothetical protein